MLRFKMTLGKDRIILEEKENSTLLVIAYTKEAVKKDGKQIHISSMEYSIEEIQPLIDLLTEAAVLANRM